MRPESLKLLWDAREAASRLEGFIAGKSIHDYLDEPMLRSAAERQLEIIGEALNQLSRSDEATAGRIPELPRIVAFRNILIHGYAEIDDQLVWSILESKLPPLVFILDELLREG